MDGINRVPDLPEDAIVVTRPDGTTIDDPSSPTKKLMAPPRANFQEVYAAGEKIANWPIANKYQEAKTALQQFGTYGRLEKYSLEAGRSAILVAAASV